MGGLNHPRLQSYPSHLDFLILPSHPPLCLHDWAEGGPSFRAAGRGCSGVCSSLFFKRWSLQLLLQLAPSSFFVTRAKMLTSTTCCGVRLQLRQPNFNRLLTVLPQLWLPPLHPGGTDSWHQAPYCGQRCQHLCPTAAG